MESDIILKKLEQYCAYQERCASDIIAKLKYWKVNETHFDSLISKLKEENFLDEERFAKAYARGQFRTNKWGKRKIFFELNHKNIPDAIIQAGLVEIDDEEYRQVLKDLILKKNAEIKNKKSLIIRRNIINFAQGKGFELDLILDIMKEFQLA
jgi:regulatory protein